MQATLGEVARHSLGKMLDKSKNRGQLQPYLRNLNVRWFEFDLSDLSEMRFLPEELDRFSIQKGDLVVCEGGYPGRAAIWLEDKPVYFQKALHRIRCAESLSNRWALYHFYHLELSGEIRTYLSGTGIQHLTGESLHRIKIPVPPLPEQQRIVGILDEAFAAIATAKANAEKNLQNARAVFERHLDSTFSTGGADWRLSSVPELAEHSLGKMLDKIKNRGTMKPYLRNINVRWFTFDLSDLLEMPFLESETSRYSVRKGDVVICEGGYPGRAAIWMADEPIPLVSGKVLYGNR